MKEALKSASVEFKASSANGARIETRWSSRSTGAEPSVVLIEAAGEITRIAELCGFGDAVEKAVADARERVRKHMASA